MIKHLTRHGNSLALVLDKPILDLLGIDADTPLEVRTDGEGLPVRPAPKKRGKGFEEAWATVRRRNAAAFKRLAE